MAKINIRVARRDARRSRVRRKVKGTALRPRLCVFRSLKYTYAQLISDETGSILASVSSRDLLEDGGSAQGVAGAKLVGAKIAELAKEKSIEQVVFDRNGYPFHGRVSAVASAAREAGLKF